MKKVMIDAGHFKSNSNKGKTGYYEHEGVWKISNYLKDILTLQGIQADLTKPYEGDLSLDRRGFKAQGYDLFISEHTNANDNTSVRGVECFYDINKPQDKIWAEELTKVVSELMGNPNRGAKTRVYTKNNKILNYYGVIRSASTTDCPHIFLIESGFHSNLVDEAFLKEDNNLRKIAEVQAKVICNILGIEYKDGESNLSYNEAKNILKTKVKLDDKTIKYLEDYTYGKDLVYKISQAVNQEEVVGKPVPSPTPPPIIKNKVIYKKYSDNIHEISGSPLDFRCKIVKKSNRSIEEPYCVNGSFQWWEDTARKKPYPTSILIQNGVILKSEANHLRDFNTPQSVIYTLKDGTVGMKRVKYATELDYKNIVCAVGGVGLVNSLDKSFAYSPATEGFKSGYNVNGIWKDYMDVLRVSNKTVLGYNIKNNKFYLLAVKNMSMSQLLKLITDNSTGEAYDFSVMGDGGGSTFLNNSDNMVVYGDGRTIHSILGFNL